MSYDSYYDLPPDEAAEWLSDAGSNGVVEHTRFVKRDPVDSQVRYLTDSFGRYRKVRRENLTEKDLEHASSELIAQLSIVNRRKEELKKQREIVDSLRTINAFAYAVLRGRSDDPAIFRITKTFIPSIDTPIDAIAKKYTYVLSFIGDKWYLTGGSRRHNIFMNLDEVLEVLTDRAASIEVYGLKVDEKLL